MSVFFPSCFGRDQTHTLKASGVEDRALLGSNPSANSGAKTRREAGHRPSRLLELKRLGLALNPRGLGTESPGSVPFLLLGFFVSSAHSSMPLFRRYSYLRSQLPHEPYSANWVSQSVCGFLNQTHSALTLALTKEPAALLSQAAHDKLPASSEPTRRLRPDDVPPRPLLSDSSSPA